jgi:hypothetical protein
LRRWGTSRCWLVAADASYLHTHVHILRNRHTHTHEHTGNNDNTGQHTHKHPNTAKMKAQPSHCKQKQVQMIRRILFRELQAWSNSSQLRSQYRNLPIIWSKHVVHPHPTEIHKHPRHNTGTLKKQIRAEYIVPACSNSFMFSAADFWCCSCCIDLCECGC